MVNVRIRERKTNRVTVRQWDEGDIDPDDRAVMLLILNREVRARRLIYGATGYRIEAWHPRRGWREHAL